MADKPALKSHVRVHVVPGDGVFFVSESGSVVFSGRHFELLVPLLGGELTRDELVDELSGKLPAAEVYFALTQLERGGMLAECNCGGSRAEAAFWEYAGGGVAEVKPPGSISVSMKTVGTVDGELVAASFREAGIAPVGEGNLSVVAADDYLRPELEPLNAERLAQRKPWMLLRPIGREIWIGPVFVPGETGCWLCLAERLRGHRQMEDFLLRVGRPFEAAPVAALPATVKTAADLAALEALRWRAGDPAALAGKVLTIDLISRQAALHPVLRRPQCPACGDPLPHHPEPPVFRSRATRFAEGAQRIETAEETLARFGHHVSPVTGIVRSLDRACTLGGPAHVYFAGHNLALQGNRFEVVERHLRSKSGGKGKSEAQARVGALCESLERYSSQFQGNEFTLRKTIGEMGDDAIHPHACMLFSERQYARRAETNRTAGAFHYVPEPFVVDRPADWAPLWSLTKERFRYLPASYLYFHTPALTDFPAVTACFPDSNGSASGNSIEEAALQGILELVERDAVAIWWYNRIPRSGIDIASFGDRYYDELTAYYRTLRREIWALDLTTDLGIPVVAALSRSVEDDERILFGFGSHLDPALALERAVTEMNQFLPKALIDRRKAKTELDDDTLRWLSGATIENQPYLRPHGVVSRSDLPNEASDDILSNFETTRTRIERLGLEVLFADFTRPDVGLPVVKIVVPGLRHFWARYAPGRLYDVPVAMGWRQQPLTEDELNPYLMFI